MTGNAFKPRPYGDSIPEAFHEIVKLVAEGYPISHAAELAGFTARGVRDYRSANPDQDAILQQARAEAHKPLVKRLLEYAGENPKTLEFVLSKWRPEEYGDTKRVEVSGRDGGPVQVEAIRRLSDAQLMAIAMGEAVPAALLAAKTEGGDDGDDV